jgi:cytosine/adenosine deaminase-related metal-dependent hydrolase
VHTSENDILFTKNSGRHLYWCLCPNANQYISRQLPDIDLLIKHDCEIVLGTDSLASNYQLSILEEMKMIQQHFPHIELKTMLQWATSKGAKALQMDSLLGSFEKGKKPGIIVLEKNTVKKIL